MCSTKCNSASGNPALADAQAQKPETCACGIKAKSSTTQQFERWLKIANRGVLIRQENLSEYSDADVY